MNCIASKQAADRRAFTLVEMLVVLGIIVVLLGIMIPTINYINKVKDRKRTAMDLHTISMALDQYYNDFKDYPRPPTGYREGLVLAWALMGPFDADKDGADGPGFRTRWDATAKTGGQVWGPYLSADRFKLNMTYTRTVSGTTLACPFILDMFGQPIEYLPKWRTYIPNMQLFNSYTPPGGIAGPGLFDEKQKYDGNCINAFRKLLGDTSKNDKIDSASGETLTNAPPYLLGSKGPRRTDWNEPVTNIDP